MKKTFLKSSPHFFRLIRAAFWLCLVLLMVAAALIPAPLQERATLSVVPNPAKSAWFLIWIQELVSYHLWLMYPLIVFCLLFVALPWLQRTSIERAAWFGRPQRLIAWSVCISFVVIVLLTVVGLFFRGENWSLVWPF